MAVGVQFTGTLSANQTKRWFTFRWPQQWHVIWYIVPTSPDIGAPQIDWDIAVERASDDHITYWITIENLTSESVNVEGRYAILN